MGKKAIGPRSNGFSLVELMIVVAIIGLLAALAVPRFQTFQAKARQSEAKSNLSHIYTLQQSFYADNDGFVALPKTGHGACVNNQLGFRPEPCARSRYEYTASVSGGGVLFIAIARSRVGNANKIFPGCVTPDEWEINQDKVLKDNKNALNVCI